MEAVYSLKLENPKIKANIFSKAFFLWMIKLCYKGTHKTLEVLDLYTTLACDKSEDLTDTLEKHWNQELATTKLNPNKSPSLIRALLKTFFWNYMLYGVLLFVQMIIIRSFQPYVLAYFISLFSESTEGNHKEMCIFGGVLVVLSLLLVISIHHIEFGQAAVGMRVRISVSSLIYRKMLRLSKKSIGETAAGQVVNLLSNDVNRFDFVTMALHYLWIAPIQIVLVTYLIWIEMGVSTLAGVLFIVCLTLPVQAYLAKLTSRLRLAVAQRTDRRVRLMNEVISGIQIIKMYAWEKPFEHIIKMTRKNEIDAVTKASYLRGVYLSCIVFIERATLFLTVTCYFLLGNPITADKVFSIAQYFNLLQMGMAICIPMAVTFGAESLISVQRLREFLMLDEKSKSGVEIRANEGVTFTNVEASWSLDKSTINNFSLCVPNGCLCAVVGPVGAGKSSVLQMLLGELKLTSGSIRVGGTMSYVSQEPWLFASTVRNNILFGQQYDKALYRKIVKVCALEKDFQQFPQGDRTVVGEKGVSLSGGQRARVNLARAVYRQADIYLLDDPLSAVDTHVGKHLFEECVLRYLRNKTRILVTHQLQYLKQADYIVVINEGRIEAQGTFTELVNSDVNFTKLLVSEEEEVEQADARMGRDRAASVISHKSTTSERSEIVEKVDNMEEMSLSDTSPFKDYVKASGSSCAVFGLLSLLVLAQAACNGSDLWVTLWTQQEAIRSSNHSHVIVSSQSWLDIFSDTFTHGDDTVRLIKSQVFIYFYLVIIILAIFLTLTRSFAFFKMAMNASKNLHNHMFHSLLKAPMRFFDTNPSGRVLNRFSKDMGAIDEFLPRILIDAVQILLVMFGILIMIVIANWYMLIAIVVIGFLFFKLRGWYLATAKDVKHLEGMTKSSVFSHLNSTYNGIVTIRASKAESVLMREFDLHQDTHTSAWFLTIATRVSFGLWLDLLSVTFIAIVIFSFILLTYYSYVSGSFVGLAISQSLILSGMLQYGMRQTAEVVNQLTSVERVMQYTKLEDEHKNTKTVEAVKEPWPSRGLIEFRDLSLRYSEADPPVLRNLNFVISPGSKIGIVGRTGAGKSSLISALFRLAPIEGGIVIDGVNTHTVPLDLLRTCISIIPQEPVLFSATLRYNLDPFQEFDDRKLWDVLEQVELKDGVRGLDTIVSEGGSNFSLGQRQLVCLARAILRNNKILVLDEATANVDPRTDSLIQHTIRKRFQDCTVLTIAHRLNTIMDSDAVLVMNGGRMVEFDHPHVLLQDPDGYFSKMVAETGPAMAQQLLQTAEEFYSTKVIKSEV